MKNRIRQIMEHERLNQKEFSETTGISPATLSSIFNGRTSPTLNHVEALLKRFPNLNITWLMSGEGEMFMSSSKDGHDSEQPLPAPSLFPDDEAVDTDRPYYASPVESGTKGNPMAGSEKNHPPFYGGNGSPQTIREIVKYIDKPQRKITEIRIFFDDGTFEVFPGK